jgi:hypothetical protein
MARAEVLEIEIFRIGGLGHGGAKHVPSLHMLGSLCERMRVPSREVVF